MLRRAPIVLLPGARHISGLADADSGTLRFQCRRLTRSVSVVEAVSFTSRSEVTKRPLAGRGPRQVEALGQLASNAMLLP